MVLTICSWLSAQQGVFNRYYLVADFEINLVGGLSLLMTAGQGRKPTGRNRLRQVSRVYFPRCGLMPLLLTVSILTIIRARDPCCSLAQSVLRGSSALGININIPRSVPSTLSL
jgi:hypothetical protein